MNANVTWPRRYLSSPNIFVDSPCTASDFDPTRPRPTADINVELIFDFEPDRNILTNARKPTSTCLRNRR